MNKTVLTFAAFAAFTANSAFAASYSGTCTTAARDKWMTEAAAQAKITEAGYTVASIKTNSRWQLLRGLRHGQEWSKNGAVS